MNGIECGHTVQVNGRVYGDEIDHEEAPCPRPVKWMVDPECMEPGAEPFYVCSVHARQHDVVPFPAARAKERAWLPDMPSQDEGIPWHGDGEPDWNDDYRRDNPDSTEEDMDADAMAGMEFQIVQGDDENTPFRVHNFANDKDMGGCADLATAVAYRDRLQAEANLVA